MMGKNWTREVIFEATSIVAMYVGLRSLVLNSLESKESVSCGPQQSTLSQIHTICAA